MTLSLRLAHSLGYNLSSVRLKLAFNGSESAELSFMHARRQWGIQLNFRGETCDLEAVYLGEPTFRPMYASLST